MNNDATKESARVADKTDLAAIKARYRGLLRVTPDLIFFINKDFIFTGYQGAEERMHVPPERFLGQPLDTILPPHVATPLQEVMEQTLTNDTVESFVYPLEGPEGVRYFEARVTACGPGEVIAFVRDVTERKQVEENLQKSEKRWHTYIEQANDLIFTLDQYGRFTSANKVALDTFGYREEEIVGTSALHLISPEDRAAVAAVLDRIFQGEDIPQLEIDAVTRDGEGIRLEVRGRALVRKDQVIETFHIARDVTERRRTEAALKESEERYRMIFTHSPLGIVHYDQEGVIVDCNEKFVEIIGSSREVLVGFDMLSSLEDERVLLAVTKSLAGETGRFEGEYQSVTAAKTTPVAAVFSQITSADGQPMGGIGIVQDVSRRKQAEEAVRRAQKLESLGVLAGGAAHDFNNLLVAMLGQTSLALNRLDAQHPARDHVQKAVKAAERAADLTRQLLTYSGRGQFETQAINLNNLITDNLHLFRVAIPKTVTLHSQLNEPLPLINGDTGQLQQIVMNLIINGGEAIGEQSGNVLVSTDTRRVGSADAALWRHTGQPLASGLYVVLQVRDDGCGMANEQIGKIFDPFYTTKFTGRGLGLAAVLGIVRSHGGGLQVQSEVGVGTTFTLTFPAREAPQRDTGDEDASGKAAASERTGTVLVIDDEAAVREAAMDILEMEGFAVVTAADGESGLAHVQKEETAVDLILLDLSMPGLGGRETLARLRHVAPDIDVLLSSGYSQTDVDETLVKGQVVGFLQKPYNIDQLIKTVRQHIYA